MSKAQSINLLPIEKIRLLNVERVNTLTTLIAAVVGVTLAGMVVVMLLLLGGVAAARAALDGQISDTNAKIAQLNRTDDPSKKLEDQGRLLQAQVATIKTILDTKQKIQFAAAIQRLEEIVPPDVSFSQAAINDSHVVTITGNARTYASVGRFAEALKKDGTSINTTQKSAALFHDVRIATTAFTSGQATVTYSLTFALGEETFNAGN